MVSNPAAALQRWSDDCSSGERRICEEMFPDPFARVIDLPAAAYPYIFGRRRCCILHFSIAVEAQYDLSISSFNTGGPLNICAKFIQDSCQPGIRDRVNHERFV